MTPAERREHIIGSLAAHPFVRVSRLSEQLGVSQMTIRRDLTWLEAEGKLARTFGGAMIPRNRARLEMLSITR
jgi:DeoR family glycerol-3-phosphate regulon repressor